MIRELSFRIPVPVIQPRWPTSEPLNRMLQSRAASAIWKSLSHVPGHEVQTLHSAKPSVADTLRLKHFHSGNETLAPSTSQLPPLRTLTCASSQAELSSGRLHRLLPTTSLVTSRPSVPSVHVSSTRHRHFLSSSKMDSAVEYGCIQHVGILVSATTASKTFYTEVLGMVEDSELSQMKLPFNCAFLRAGSSQIHLMEHPAPDTEENRPQLGARYVHSHVFVLTQPHL